MYQPYPGGAQMPQDQRPPAPASVLTAVQFMYAGAVASLIGIVVDLTTLSTTKSAIEEHSPDLTASQVDSVQRTLVVGGVLAGLIGAALWVFIARACKSGKNWARITGTVFFAIATVNVFGGLAAPEAALVKAFGFVVWLIGLGAVVSLWRGSSNAFFTGPRP